MESSNDLSLESAAQVSQGISRSGRIRKKSAKFADFFESADEVLPLNKKKTPLKSPTKVSKPESSTSESTSSSSDDSDDSDSDSDDFGEDDGAIDLKDGFLEYGDWEDDLGMSGTPNSQEEAEDGNLQVDEDATSHSRKNANFSQAQSLYFSEKKKPSVKGPFMKQKKADRKDKGKSRITAYMLWARENRSEITDAFPEMDFSSVNKRLGELWALVPTAQKFLWKRKAKRLANRTEKSHGGSMISTGKGRAFGPSNKSKLINKGKTQPVGRPPKQTEPKMSPSILASEASQMPMKPALQTPKPNKSISGVIGDASPPNIFKVAGTSPIDVAAHLKLLGESLNNIGQKLKEHEGQIAVSGSLSVLLDSMLCVLGPLACLTNQLEETQSAISEDTLNNILDNIAYIMPGIV